MLAYARIVLPHSVVFGEFCTAALRSRVNDAAKEPIAIARARSLTISTRRRYIRSTHAPAGSPISRKASVSTATSRTSSNVDVSTFE